MTPFVATESPKRIDNLLRVFKNVSDKRKELERVLLAIEKKVNNPQVRENALTQAGAIATNMDQMKTIIGKWIKETDKTRPVLHEIPDSEIVAFNELANTTADDTAKLAAFIKPFLTKRSKTSGDATRLDPTP